MAGLIGSRAKSRERGTKAACSPQWVELRCEGFHTSNVSSRSGCAALRTLRPSGSDRGAATMPEAEARAAASTTAATSVDPIAVESEPIVTIVRRELLGPTAVLPPGLRETLVSGGEPMP